MFSYYNASKLLRYNGTYNFVVGGRGIGKTYDFKKRAISRAVLHGEQFIYVRRYKTELTKSRATFLADLTGLFKGTDFKVEGSSVLMAPSDTRSDKKREWSIIGHFVALSTAQTQKSVAYPLVKTIIFDEFIIESGGLRYLPDEFTIFNNFYSTVDRWKDKTKVYFLANSVSIMNPYFLALNIQPDAEREFCTRNSGFVVAQFIDSDKFASEVYQTRFGKFIAGTEYAEYAVANTFGDNHNVLLSDKNPDARYRFTLECATGEFSVWGIGAEYYVQEKQPRQPIVYTLLAEKMDSHKVLMRLNDTPLSHLRSAFRMGRVTFDKPTTRNTFAEIFK